MAARFVEFAVAELLSGTATHEEVTMLIINTHLITFLYCIISIIMKRQSMLLPVSATGILSEYSRLLTDVQSLPTLAMVGNVNWFHVHLWFAEALLGEAFPWVTKSIDLAGLSASNWFAHSCFPIIHFFEISLGWERTVISVISLSKVYQTISWALTSWSFRCTSTTDWWIRTFSLLSLMKSNIIKMSLCINP